ncbi:phosphatase PAP2 family protein [Streptomyces sp. NPDC001262]|uniref:phosphatase PAP2 family protein n=1 Tax=Streptomyces sp. NPDC001262 TaxID=3364552 RepID=UPI0036BE2117
MNATPGPQGTAGDAEPVPPQCRSGRALAHTTGAAGPGHPHRSNGCSSHTPRGARSDGRNGDSGTIPPVPGSPSSRLFLLPLLCALLFALTAWQVAAHGPLRTLDEHLGRAVAGSAFPRPLAGFLADLGNATVAVPVLVMAMAVWFLRFRHSAARPWLPPLAAALAMAAVPALVVPLKTWIARPGPPPMAGVHEGFFPSGHAATAAVAYGAAVLLLFRGSWWARWAAAGYALLNAAVGVGLVRCGYHWPLDVAGAWCLSGVVLWGPALSCRNRARPCPSP